MVVVHERSQCMKSGLLRAGWSWGRIDVGGWHARFVANNARSRSAQGSGVATLQQLASAGTSRTRVRRLVKAGRLLAVRRGVYTSAERAAASAVDKRRAHALQVAAVLASCDFPAVASHRSAALIHGLDLIGRHDAETVTVTRSPRSRGSRSLRGGVSIHAAELPVRHLVVRDGISLTSVARTVVDLGQDLHVPRRRGRRRLGAADRPDNGAGDRRGHLRLRLLA